jgi:hypothetical protein
MGSGESTIHGQAEALNRILSIGAEGRARVQGHIDTGERVEGNPVWIFELEVTPHGGRPYRVRHREIVSSAVTGGFPEGVTIACRIDPDDPQQIAFGRKPFM